MPIMPDLASTQYLSAEIIHLLCLERVNAFQLNGTSSQAVVLYFYSTS